MTKDCSLKDEVLFVTVRVELTNDEEAALWQTFHQTDERKLRNRCQAILMVARNDRRRSDIARDLGCAKTTLSRWVRLYRSGGLKGLEIVWHTGPTSKIPPELTEQIIGWVKEGPVSCGLDRANWTHEELAQHLYRTHGIRVSHDTIRRFCLAHNIHPYRPTYRFLRAKPEKQAVAQREIEELKKEQRRAR